MEQPLPQHRRTYTRFFLESQGTIILNENREIPLVVKDVSVRGAGVVSNYAFNKNDKVQFVIKAPFFFKTPVYKDARIVWSRNIKDNLWESGLDFGRDFLQLPADIVTTETVSPLPSSVSRIQVD